MSGISERIRSSCTCNRSGLCWHCQYSAEVRELEHEVARLRAMLARARDAIAQAPIEAFGTVPEAHDHPAYPIRDELVDRITKALAHFEQEGKT